MSMSTVSVPQQQQRIVLNVDWDSYVGIGEYLRDQPVRMTYDRGALEIMTLSLQHEQITALLARMVGTLTEELNIDMFSGRSTTFRREELDRGLEADECWWFEHEEQMRGKTEFDPHVDPPPELALEVEISRSVIKRLPIYAALRIPEVWRYDGKTLQVLHLASTGEYQPGSSSKALPIVPVAELVQFLDLRNTLSETQVIRQFRAWVRQQQATEWGAKKASRRKKK
jgi:Uma2 family endonuclease